jgi:hypothetical protein
MKSWLNEEEDSSTNLTPRKLVYEGRKQTLDAVPRRLIHIPPSTSQENGRLCLVDSADLLDAGYPPYVTLSHRWGVVHSFITTKTRLKSRQDGFDLQELPKTYRDAAIVSSRLGFEYLWIDALCIVQDDMDDWLCESEKMGIIYRCATFTIANHCSETDDGGFLEAALQKRGSIKFK